MIDIYEEYLTIIANCYKNKEFKELYPLLAKDVVWQSNWVLEPRIGYDTVVSYYKKKEEQLKNSSWTTFHTLVKTLDPFSKQTNNVHTSNGLRVMLAHEKNKLLDYVVQVNDKNEKTDSIIDIKINEDKLITEINMCIADLYNFEKYKELF